MKDDTSITLASLFGAAPQNDFRGVGEGEPPGLAHTQKDPPATHDQNRSISKVASQKIKKSDKLIAKVASQIIGTLPEKPVALSDLFDIPRCKGVPLDQEAEPLVYRLVEPMFRTKEESRKAAMAATPENMERIKSMVSDYLWRMNNLYVILDEDGNTVQFTMRPEQLEFARNRHNRNFVPKARKLGMSTFIVLDYLDSCLFNRNFRAGHIDLKEEDAKDKLAIARFAWDKGPTDHPNEGIRLLWQRIHATNPLARTSSTSRLQWRNGSIQSAGVRYTGKTPFKLHVSEYGPIAVNAPRVAVDIKRGSMNSVPKSGKIDVETTMEGGRIGECYSIFEQAQKAAQLDELTELDWKLHYFSWLGHPSYKLPGKKPARQSTHDYFEKVQKEDPDEIKKHFKDGIVPNERRAWWEKKHEDLGDLMWQQYPTIISECVKTKVAGQIYPYTNQLRALGRVREFAHEKHLPFFVSTDLGSSDNIAMWLHQPAGADHNVIDCKFGEEDPDTKGAAFVAKQVLKWEQEYGIITQILLPHDANITDKGGGVTYVEALVKCGIDRKRIVVVQRTPDVWAGIEAVRRLLPKCWFHSRCDQKPKDPEGNEYPSGFARLENYRTKPAVEGEKVVNLPVHDICSHAADGFRNFAEALALHRVKTHLRIDVDDTGHQFMNAPTGQGQGKVTVTMITA